MDEDFYLCSNCANDIYLKNYININATRQEKTCTVCKTNMVSINIDDNPRLNSFCRFLIRYHLPEYVYNPKWGGDNFPAPFFQENDIISHNFKDIDSREEEIEIFLDCLFNLNMHPFDDLYYGNDEHGKSLFMWSIKMKGSYYWKYYKRELIIKNYFLLKKKAIDEFKEIFENYKFEIDIDSVFNRARIGFDVHVDDLSDIIPIETKVPYKGNEISAPPILKAKSGRLNRQGVSYLYLSSSKDGAIGEVRPHPGHYVSVGKFKSNSKLLIADLRFIDLFDYFDNDEKLKKFLFIKDISNELFKTVLPDEQDHYLITQFISDIIRDLGYDGVTFESSVTDGYNLVVFDSTKFNFIDDSSDLLKIRELTYGIDLVEYDYDSFVGQPIEKLKVYNNVNEKLSG